MVPETTWAGYITYLAKRCIIDVGYVVHPLVAINQHLNRGTRSETSPTTYLPSFFPRSKTAGTIVDSKAGEILFPLFHELM